MAYYRRAAPDALALSVGVAAQRSGCSHSHGWIDCPLAKAEQCQLPETTAGF